MTPSRLSVPLALAVALTLSAGCHSNDAEAPAPVVAVQVAAVQQVPLEHWVRSEGQLFPVNQAIITPKISAPVSKFLVNRGSHVRAGEVVAELENRDLTAAAQESAGQYETAQANYQNATAGTIPADLTKAQLDVKAAVQTAANAQKVYDSRQELFRQGAVAAKDLNQAAADLTAAKNALELAQQHLQQLEASGHTQALKAAAGDLQAAQAHAAGAAAEVGYSEIKSPINGVVTDRPVWPGELATTTSPLMTIMDISSVVAKVHLPVAQAALVKVGDRATLNLNGSDLAAEAKVTLVSPATDPGSTTLEVWVTAPNSDGTLRPGTTANVAILADTIPNALTIPAAAVLTDPGNGETTVMLAGADSIAHQQTIKVGLREPDQVQVLDGLKLGDRVITVGAFGLPDKTKIKIVTPEPADDDEGGAAL